MARYIDADKFKEFADKPSIFDTTDLKAMIDEQPTADVMEVVRCKDCIYFTNNINNPNLRNGYCNLKKAGHFYNVKDTDYCSCGQKKEEK